MLGPLLVRFSTCFLRPIQGQKFQGGENMKLSDIVHQSRRTIAYAACIVFIIIVILRIFTFREDCQKIKEQVTQKNRIEHQRNSGSVPFVSLAGRPTKNSEWQADGFIARPGKEFQIQLNFWNNLDISCLKTKFSGTTKSELVIPTPSGRYCDTEGNDYHCILGTDKNHVELNTGDHSPKTIFHFEQTYQSKFILFGEPAIEQIMYTVSNDHFISTANYYIGIIPVISWAEVLEFIVAITYLAVAIILESYDSYKAIKESRQHKRKRNKTY